MKKYFNWDELFKKYPQYKKAILQVVITERNVGKTYGTYAYLDENKTFTPDNKTLVLRNSDKELQKTKRDFSNRYKNRLMVKGDFIYNLKWEKLVSKEGEEITIPRADEVVGYFASINNYVNYKSIEAKDIRYIMYEEFNEDTVIGRNIYFKFFNILKTFERFNKLEYVFMLGNKDGFDSDYFVNWGIVPNDNKEENKITPIQDDYGLIGVVYDFGSNEFANLSNQSTLSSRLAMLDNRTAVFNLGGYLKQHCQRVINYRKILEDFQVKCYLSIGYDKYVLGKYLGNYAIISPWNYNQNLDITNYSFDIMSGLMNDSQILDEQDHIDLLNFLYSNEKSNNMYYDSYDTRTIVHDLLFIHKRYIQKQ